MFNSRRLRSPVTRWWRVRSRKIVARNFSMFSKQNAVPSNTAALLLGTNPKRMIAEFLGRVERDHVTKTLYVKFVSQSQLDHMISKNEVITVPVNKDEFRKAVLEYYNKLPNVVLLDLRIVMDNFRNPEKPTFVRSKPVDLLYLDVRFPTDRLQKIPGVILGDAGIHTMMFPCYNYSPTNKVFSETPSDSEYRDYDFVAIGGTFDNLHSGHKALLSEAILRCRTKLTIGVTSDNMIQKKVLHELIADFEDRVAKLQEFLQDVEPALEYNIVELHDMYGPTVEDASLEMIVVSSETKEGAEEINRVRIAKGMGELAIHTVEVIPSVKILPIEEGKVSSSNYRIRKLGNLVRQPEDKNLPKRPYVFAVTGIVTSGKTTVCNFLKLWGCVHLDCEQVVTELCKLNNPGYGFVKDLFPNAIDVESGAINRMVLTTITDADPEKRAKYIEFMSPLVVEHLKERIRSMGKSAKHKIIMVETSVLIQTDWQQICNEVWSCVVTEELARHRLRNRRWMTEEQISACVKAQRPGRKVAQESNIVISTVWDYDFTRYQVQKAWCTLQHRLGII